MATVTTQTWVAGYSDEGETILVEEVGGLESNASRLAYWRSAQCTPWLTDLHLVERTTTVTLTRLPEPEDL